jgi:methionine-rich copper-binding protein CopC
MNAGAAARAVALALLGVAADALAHVALQRAVPAPDSVVHGSPAEVRLWFTDPIEAVFSAVVVRDGDGRRVDAQDPRVDPSDSACLHVSLRSLPPGIYRVHWRAVSVDTHVTEGDFTFAVRP